MEDKEIMLKKKKEEEIMLKKWNILKLSTPNVYFLDFFNVDYF